MQAGSRATMARLAYRLQHFQLVHLLPLKHHMTHTHIYNRSNKIGAPGTPHAAAPHAPEPPAPHTPIAHDRQPAGLQAGCVETQTQGGTEHTHRV